MKAAKVLLPVLLLLLIGLSPGPALAADSDFRISVNPLLFGLGPKGGSVTPDVSVWNEGDTDITWINVVVNTQAGFSRRVTHTIAPGDSYTIGLSLPLAAADVGKQLLVQVSMNNDGSANPDGVKMASIRVDRIDPVFTVSASVSPDRSTYSVGDTITITHRYTNHVVDRLLGIDDTITMAVGSDVVHRATEGVEVGPGRTETASFQYTLGREDVGRLSVTHYATTMLAGKPYEAAGSIQLTVRAPRPEFTAVLTADPATITAGEPVTATVRITNTSDHTTDFVIYDSGRTQRGTIDNVPAGAARDFVEEIHPSVSGDVSYIVKGKIGSESSEKTTNAVAITVSPVTTSSSSATSSEPGTTTSAEVTTTVPDAGTTTSAAISAEAAATGKTTGLSNTWIIVIVAVVAVVLVAAIVTTGVVIVKKRGQV